MAIRYDKKLNQTIEKVVRNYNQKIARLQREENSLVLPNKVSIKELKRASYNRVDLKRRLDSLQRFSKRGAENIIITSGGVKITRYELEETERSLKRIKSALTRSIKNVGNMQPTIFGEKQKYTYAQMGSQKVANLQARRLNLNVGSLDKLTKEGYKRLQSLIESNEKKLYSQNSLFKEKYANEILFNLAYSVGYDEEKIDVIRKKLVKLSDDEFYKIFSMEQSLQAGVDYYISSKDLASSPMRMKDEVTALFDNIYENLDDILKSYK